MILICIFPYASKISLLLFAWLRRHFYWIFCAQNICIRKFSKHNSCRKEHKEPLYAGPGPVGWVVWHTLSRPSGPDSHTSRHRTGCCSGTCRLCTASFPGRPPTAGKTKCGQKLAARPLQVFRAGHLPRVKRSVVKNLPLDLRKFSGQATYRGKNEV